MSDRLRVLIADDERPAREFLAGMLRGIQGVEIAGEARDGAEALKLVSVVKPDVVLLDMQMPERDGMALARLLHRKATPLVIFVTAFESYAVRAFEVDAVDYLLKPVSAARLRGALRRAAERLDLMTAGAGTGRRTADAIGPTDTAAAYLDRLPMRVRDEIVLVPVNHVASIVADGELLKVTTARNERYTVACRLKGIEERLDPGRFVRLGRGAIVNVDAIARITPMPGGTYLVTLHNAQQLPVSRVQSKLLRERFLRL